MSILREPKEYWASSFAKLKSIRYLAVIGLMIALKVVLNSLRIPVGDNLNILFTFVPTAIEAAIVGPGAAMVSAVITDIVGYIVSPFGPYFPGYMISKMMGSLIFGLFFYRRPFTFVSVVLSKTLINYFVNVLMGSMWSQILYGKGFLFYASASLIKNTVLLPVEILILYAIMRSLLPVLERKGFIRSKESEPETEREVTL